MQLFMVIYSRIVVPKYTHIYANLLIYNAYIWFNEEEY